MYISIAMRMKIYNRFVSAIESNSIAEIQRIFRYKQNLVIFKKDVDSYHLLVHALDNDRREIVKLFLEHNCRVFNDFFTEKYCTPLFYAVDAKDKDLLSALLNRGALINDRDCNKDTALMRAMEMKDYAAVKLMLTKYFDQNKDVKVTDDDHMAALFAAYFVNERDVVQRFFDKGVRPKGFETVRSMERKQLNLFYAVNHGYAGLVTLLLYQGANVMEKNQEGSTPVHQAFLKHLLHPINYESLHKKIVDQMLLTLTSLGTITNCVDKNGLSHFHIACANDNTEVVKKFLDSGVGVDQLISSKSCTIFSGYTPLHLAAKFQSLSVIPVLLRHNADINAIDSEGNTPLCTLFCNFQKSKLKVSATEKLIKSILEEHWKNVHNHTNKHGLSHFHIACALGNVKIVQWLLKKGASIDDAPSTGEFFVEHTPIDFAMEFSNSAVIQFLLEENLNLKNLHIDEQVVNEIIMPLMLQHVGRTNKKSKKRKKRVLHKTQCDCPKKKVENINRKRLLLRLIMHVLLFLTLIIFMCLHFCFYVLCKTIEFLSRLLLFISILVHTVFDDAKWCRYLL